MFRNFDWILFLSSLLLLALGILSIFSTNPSAANSQFIFAMIGVLLFFSVAFLDYKLLKQFVTPLYIIGIASLLLVLIFGTKMRGSVRWFQIGQYGIQPSEFIKIILVLILANFLAGLKRKEIEFYEIIKTALFTFLLALPVFLQPDLGTTISLLFVWLFLLIFFGIRAFYILIFIALSGILSFPLWNLLKGYQKERITTFFNPAYDPLGSGYHVLQSIIAVGSGKFFGKGLGSGTQSHLKYLPAYYTDFIFASFAEEWGLIGVFVFLALFFVLLIRILKIALKTDDPFGHFICIGVFALILFQFFVSVGMNIGIMPVTGIPLPLFSYGGSSLITTFILLGLVQSVARSTNS